LWNFRLFATNTSRCSKFSLAGERFHHENSVGQAIFFNQCARYANLPCGKPIIARLPCNITSTPYLKIKAPAGLPQKPGNPAHGKARG